MSKFQYRYVIEQIEVFGDELEYPMEKERIVDTHGTCANSDKQAISFIRRRLGYNQYNSYRDIGGHQWWEMRFRVKECIKL